MAQIENMARIGCAEILPLKTVTVPPYTTTNAVIYGHKSFVVIDPGSPDHEQQLLLIERLSARIDEGHDFLGVLLTHHHGDHTKGALKISKDFSVPIMAHDNARHHLSFTVDRVLFDQEVVFLEDNLSVQARYTPGHADDHMVYYDELNGVLIAGDMITDRGTVLIPPLQGDLKTYLESLDSLTTLKLKIIIPAHGKAIIEKPLEFLLKALKHRYERISSVFDVLCVTNQATLDATDITHKVYGTSIPDNVMIFAQLSVESSLQWLNDNGLVKKVDHRWLVASRDNAAKDKVILCAQRQIDERLRNT
jgi:endoribonuclease LACTB2